MFQLSKEEHEALRFHFGISKRGGVRYRPYAFTENGVAMLSSVLRSQKAIQINIQIMRTFTHIRELMASHKEILKKVQAMESKYDQQFRIVFEAIEQLIKEDTQTGKRIGFV